MCWCLANYGKLQDPGTCCGWSLRAVLTLTDLALGFLSLSIIQKLKMKTKSKKNKKQKKTLNQTTKTKNQKAKTKSDSLNNKKFAIDFKSLWDMSLLGFCHSGLIALSQGGLVCLIP